MVTILARNWWLVVLRGVAAVLFGIATLIAPAISLLFLVLLFGWYSLVDGVVTLISAVRAGGADGRPWGTILEGIVGIVVGLVTLAWPGISALALLYLIAAWALLTGLLEIIAAVRLRREIEHEWLLGLAGVASLLFGVVLVLSPGAGALAVVTLIGAYALVFGVLLIALGLRLRGIHNKAEGRISASEPGAPLLGRPNP